MIPRRKLLIINKVWELYCLILFLGLLALPFGTDKTIATHTKDYIETLQT